MGQYSCVDMVKIDKTYRNRRNSLEEDTIVAIKTNDMQNNIYDIVEIDILNRIRHRNIIEICDTIGTIIYGDCINIKIIMPLASCNLADCIREQGPSMKPLMKKHIMHQLLSGLSYLHFNHIVHDDIKPNNILVFRDNNDDITVKICDFGLSGVVTSPFGICKVSQTSLWRPPEILKEEIRTRMFSYSYLHSFESDIWAMGVVFMELIRGDNPFDYINHGGLKFRQMEPEERVMTLIQGFLKDDWTSNPCFDGHLTKAPDLISKMLEPDPKKRISSKNSLQHPLFSEFEYQDEIVETIPWDMDSYISPSERRQIFEWMNIRRDSTRTDFQTLFLSYDIFDRYLAALTKKGTEHHLNWEDHHLLARTVLCMANNITYCGCKDVESYMDMSYRTYSKRDFTNMTHNIMKALDWVIFRPTLYNLVPELDPIKVYQCYLETHTPTMELYRSK